MFLDLAPNEILHSGLRIFQKGEGYLKGSLAQDFWTNFGRREKK